MAKLFPEKVVAIETRDAVSPNHLFKRSLIEMVVIPKKVAPAALAFSLSLITLYPCQARDNSIPIVDVSFDAPYQQIESSQGDEWGPAWGADDALYTGNDDGSSFGGIPVNAIAFGKVEGDGMKSLKGVTINSMSDYREVPVSGPEGAIWKASHSYQLDRKFYRFTPCARGEPSNCLMVSEDGGKNWLPTNTVFPTAVLKDPAFVTFQSGYARSPLSEGDFNDHVFISAYAGLVDNEDRYIIGRIAKDKLTHASTQDWTFSSSEDDLGGWTRSPKDAKPLINNFGLGPDMANWKTMNSYSVVSMVRRRPQAASHLPGLKHNQIDRQRTYLDACGRRERPQADVPGQAPPVSR